MSKCDKRLITVGYSVYGQALNSATRLGRGLISYLILLFFAFFGIFKSFLYFYLVWIKINHILWNYILVNVFLDICQTNYQIIYKCID